MRLNLAKLRDRGWSVDVTADAVTIYGDRPLPIVTEMMAGLMDIGISEREADYLVGDFADALVQKLILRDAS